jgi:hypothetical protein
MTNYGNPTAFQMTEPMNSYQQIPPNPFLTQQPSPSPSMNNSQPHHGFPILALIPILAIAGVAVFFLAPVVTKQQTLNERISQLFGSSTLAPAEPSTEFVPLSTESEPITLDPLPITPDPVPTVTELPETIPQPVPQPEPTIQTPILPKTGIGPNDPYTGL